MNKQHALLTALSLLLTLQLPSYAQDREALEQACSNDDAESCFTLSYRYGDDGDKEREEELFERSCELGFGEGCVALAVRLAPMTQLLSPSTKARELFELGCELGTTSGCANAGMIHEAGRGTAVNTESALAFYRRGCDELANPRLCYSVARLEEKLKGRPSTRGKPALPMTLFDVTIGRTTIEQLTNLHDVNYNIELGCAGGRAYSISASKLEEQMPGSVEFYFNSDGVLSGMTTDALNENLEQVRADFNSRYESIPVKQANAIGANELWMHGDTEILFYAPSYARVATIGYFDWGYKGRCFPM